MSTTHRVLWCCKMSWLCKALPGTSTYWTERSISDPGFLSKDFRTIREQGYVEGLTEGAAALGSLVRNWKSEVGTATSIGGVCSHSIKNKLPGLIKIVKNAAQGLSPDVTRLHEGKVTLFFARRSQ